MKLLRQGSACHSVTRVVPDFLCCPPAGWIPAMGWGRGTRRRQWLHFPRVRIWAYKNARLALSPALVLRSCVIKPQRGQREMELQELPCVVRNKFESLVFGGLQGYTGPVSREFWFSTQWQNAALAHGVNWPFASLEARCYTGNSWLRNEHMWALLLCYQIGVSGANTLPFWAADPRFWRPDLSLFLATQKINLEDCISWEKGGTLHIIICCWGKWARTAYEKTNLEGTNFMYICMWAIMDIEDLVK